MGKVSFSTVAIPVTKFGDENPTPIFRDFPMNQDLAIEVEKGTTIDSKTIDMVGANTGKRLLPYIMQSNYSKDAVDTQVLHICIENEFIRAVILPEWGGRLLSLYDKKRERELLYNPGQIILRNLAIRNAWFAGGIEWNAGFYGHSTNTCSPVYCCTVESDNGEQSLRIFNHEKISDLWWQVDFILHPKSPILEAIVTVYNDQDQHKQLYWWTNIAVPEYKHTRVLASNSLTLWRSNIQRGFQYVHFPYPHGNTVVDYSYSTNYPKSSEFFFEKPPKGKHPWIACVDKNGNAFFEASTHQLPYRKMFCWGTHQGGRNWQKLLRNGKGIDYLELQAGIAPSQLHYADISPRKKVQWTHYFGSMQLDPRIAHDANSWDMACQHAAKKIASILGNDLSKTVKRDYISLSTKTPSDFFLSGKYRAQIDSVIDSNSILPQWLINYVEKELTNDNMQNNRWYKLLYKNSWTPYINNEKIEWMIDNRYKTALKKIKDNEKADWAVYLHLGVIERELFNFSLARDYFIQSLQLQPNQFAWWGLIETAFVNKDKQEMRKWIKEAMPYIHSFDLKLAILIKACKCNLWKAMLSLLDTLTPDEKKSPKLTPLLCQLELYNGHPNKAMKYFLQDNYYRREGDDDYVAIWQALHADANRVPELPSEMDYRMAP